MIEETERNEDMLDKALDRLVHVGSVSDNAGTHELVEAIKDFRLSIDGGRKPCPLRYLRDLAFVTDAPCRKVTAKERLSRTGPYLYYTRGYGTEPIDDFTIDGRYLLVGRLGSVCTFHKRLLVVSCQGKGMPSDLFTAVVAKPHIDHDYLFQVLRSTMAPPFMQGNDIVQEITPARLKHAIIPYPEKSIRQAFTRIMSTLDSLACDAADGRDGNDLDLFQALSATRDCLGLLFLQCTHDMKMLVDDDIERPALTEEAESCRQPEADGSAVDMTFLDLLDKLFSLLIEQSPIEKPTVVDVVASTDDLMTEPGEGTYDICICMPAPNQGMWSSLQPSPDDRRWILGMPPRNKANYAWIMQTISMMASDGYGLMLLCNSALISERGRERNLRIELAKSGVIECVIALPGQMFSDNRPPSSLVIFRKNRPSGSSSLMIDASELGETTVSTSITGLPLRSLSRRSMEKITDSCRRWLSQGDIDPDGDMCEVVDIDEMKERDYLLSPWAYRR